VISALILAVIILAVLGSAAKRMLDMQGVPAVAVLAMLGAAAAPSWVAWEVLNPGEPLSTATVRGEKEVVTLDVPEGYAIMATAVLTDEDDSPRTDKTAYSFEVRGQGWGHTASGTFKKEGAGGGPDVSLDGGKGISDSTRKRSGGLGEDVQDRIDPMGHGATEVEVKNWMGGAVLSVDLEVVKAPPPAWMLWLIACAISLLGVIAEVYKGADRLAGDIGVLAMWSVFMREGVTPLDSWQGLLGALLPGALLGWALVGGIAWLGIKYIVSREAKKEMTVGAAVAAGVEPPPESATPAPVASPKRTRTRTRTRVIRPDDGGSET